MRSRLEHTQKRGTKDTEKIDDIAPYRVFPQRENVLISLSLTELFMPQASYIVRGPDSHA